MSAAKRFEWERAIRALPIRPPVRKLVALMVGTYASADGTNAHPGEDRLAEECGITPRAVRGHLAALRDLGLIVRTFEGAKGGRRKLADVYALEVPADVLTRLKAADHRNDGSGDVEPITGASASDHRNVGADHRNLGGGITGSHVPPTITGTKDVEHASPNPTHSPASTTGGAREGVEQIEFDQPHPYKPDEWNDKCRCGLPQLNVRHRMRKASA